MLLCGFVRGFVVFGLLCLGDLFFGWMLYWCFVFVVLFTRFWVVLFVYFDFSLFCCFDLIIGCCTVGFVVGGGVVLL